MKLVVLKGNTETWNAKVGEAIGEARRAGGLDAPTAAHRLNRVTGRTIYSAVWIEAWEAGREMPSAAVFLAAVIAFAGNQAAQILAGIAG